MTLVIPRERLGLPRASGVMPGIVDLIRPDAEIAPRQQGSADIIWLKDWRRSGLPRASGGLPVQERPLFQGGWIAPRRVGVYRLSVVQRPSRRRLPHVGGGLPTVYGDDVQVGSIAPRRKEMDNDKDIREHERLLNGVLQCEPCGKPMLKVGANYICPTQVTGSQHPCPTRPVNAHELLQLTVIHIIGRTINDKTVEQITGNIQDEYGKKAQHSQDDLDRAEEAISALNALKNKAVHAVEHQDKPYSDVAEEIEQFNLNTIALSYEARRSRREIDGYDFISDPERIKANALDPDTYLGSASPEDTRELLDMFVRSIEAGEDSFTINFTDNVPRTGQPDQCLSDRIPLG